MQDGERPFRATRSITSRAKASSASVMVAQKSKVWSAGRLPSGMYRTSGYLSFKRKHVAYLCPGYPQPIHRLKEVSMSKSGSSPAVRAGLAGVLAEQVWQRGTAWSPLPASRPNCRSHRALWCDRLRFAVALDVVMHLPLSGNHGDHRRLRAIDVLSTMPAMPMSIRSRTCRRMIFRAQIETNLFASSM